MSVNLKHLDSFKLTGRLQTNFACDYSQDDRFFIISEDGIYIITLKPDLSIDFLTFSCYKHFFKPSDYSLSDKVDIDLNTFISQLPKELIYESILKVELSSNLLNATSVKPTVRTAAWSPDGMVDKTGCMLALLTNLYSLEVYVKSLNVGNMVEYMLVLNLTNEILERKRGEFKYSAKLPPVTKFNELKRRVEYIAPTAFCWGHTFIQQCHTCTVMFVGHFTGAISVWKIFGTDSSADKVKCEFLGRYDTKLGQINTLYWHQTREFGGGLCIGDNEGQIAVLQVKNLNENEVFMDNEVQFCTEKDRAVEKLTVMCFNGYTILVAVKQSYLLFYGLNSSGKVIDFVVHNVENFFITGLYHQENTLKVLTFTGSYKQLVLSVHLNKICVEETIIPLKLDCTRNRTHGFINSTNDVMLGIIVAPFTLKSAVGFTKQCIIFNLFYDVNLSPLKLLLENKSDSLKRFWDCLELLRLVCLKEQRFPWLGIDPNLDYDTLSLFQLKTLRLVAKISETAFNHIRQVFSYDIKPYILLHHLVKIKLITNRLNELFNLKHSGQHLSLFQLRSIDLQVFYLKEMVVGGILPKANVGHTFIEEIGHVISIANEMTFPDMVQCCFCGEKLIGPICVPPHADSRCCLSMMPIFVAPALQCRLCKALVHNEMCKEIFPISCPFCDCPMEKICIDENIAKKLEEGEKVFSENGVKSKCFSDCEKDSSDVFECLEENETEYVIFSDSDCEEEKGKLRDIYFKVAQMTIEDVKTFDVDDEGESDDEPIVKAPRVE